VIARFTEFRKNSVKEKLKRKFIGYELNIDED
jgi:hypothetical protein